MSVEKVKPEYNINALKSFKQRVCNQNFCQINDIKHYFFTRLSKIACLNSGMLLYINIV